MSIMICITNVEIVVNKVVKKMTFDWNKYVPTGIKMLHSGEH